ncbi:MAG TPA: hypothetical protein VN026_15565 [Bacteroidia bacterium]|jgi:hypothetical protein|nr:hypothetical protein [Bacteroidia bacterium]
MKKIILLSSFFLLCNREYAQIEKGTYVPSISLNFGYSSSPDNNKGISSKINDRWNGGATIGFGRFIKNNLLISGSIGYGYSYQNSSYTNNYNVYDSNGSKSYSNSVTLSGGLFKYKFFNENFAIRFGANITSAYSDGFSKNYSYNYYVDTYGNPTWINNNSDSYKNAISVQGNLQAGILYFLNRNLALTGSMGFFSASYSMSPYQKLKNKTDDAHTLSFSLTPSFNAFSLGLTYYIRPKINK